MLPAFGARVERDGLRAAVRGGQRADAARTSPCRATRRARPSSSSPRSCCPTPRCGSTGSSSRRRARPSSTCCGRWAATSRRRSRRPSPEPVGSIVARSSALHGTRVDPAVGAGAHRRGAGPRRGRRLRRRAPSPSPAPKELRVKESDRIAALAEGLGAMGARVARAARRPRRRGRRAGCAGGAVRSHGDHRIAMALAVAGLAAAGRDRDRRRRVRRGVLPDVLRRAAGGHRRGAPAR